MMTMKTRRMILLLVNTTINIFVTSYYTNNVSCVNVFVINTITKMTVVNMTRSVLLQIVIVEVIIEVEII